MEMMGRQPFARRRRRRARRILGAVIALSGFLVAGAAPATSASTLPVIELGATSLVEGTGGLSTMTVPVTLSTASVDPVSFDWTLLSLDAEVPDDMPPASGTVTFAPGDTDETIEFSIVADVIDEPDEWVVVSSSNPTNATLGGYLGLGFGVIIDDDDPPVIVPGSTSIDEGAADPVAHIPVTLSAPSSFPVSFQWMALDYEATPDVDFTADEGAVVIQPGQTTAQLPIVVLDDEIGEPDEVAVVLTGNPTNATIGGFWGLGSVTIIDDDEGLDCNPFAPGPNARLRECDLTGVDLSGLDLSHADLTRAILTDASLAGTDLAHATLTGVSSGGVTGVPAALPTDWQLGSGHLLGPGADLADAALAGAVLVDIDLTGADLSRADLTGAVLVDPVMTGTTMVGASLGSAVLVRADLTGADMETAFMPGVHMSDALLRGANLAGTQLGGADLSGTDLTGASLAGASVTNLDLTGADLGNTDLDDVIFSSVSLTNADLVGANIRRSAIVNSEMTNADLTDVDLSGGGGLVRVTFTNGSLAGADLTDAALVQSQMTGLDLSGASLEQASIIGDDLLGADLSGSYFGFVTWDNNRCPDGSFSDLSGNTCLRVDVDVDPQSPLNVIGISDPSRTLAVAVLGTDDFDAAGVDAATWTFGLNGWEASPTAAYLDDVDNDTDTDAVTEYRVGSTGLRLGDTVACTQGNTTLGERFFGCDNVTVDRDETLSPPASPPASATASPPASGGGPFLGISGADIAPLLQSPVGFAGTSLAVGLFFLLAFQRAEVRLSDEDEEDQLEPHE